MYVLARSSIMESSNSRRRYFAPYDIPCWHDNPYMFCRSTYLYDTLRPKLIHETNVDLLCELVDILKVEVLGEQLSRRSESLAGLRPTLERILADVHERLTFRARTHIRDEVCYLLIRAKSVFCIHYFHISLLCCSNIVIAVWLNLKIIQ